MTDTYIELTDNDITGNIDGVPETVPVILLRDQVALPKITLPLSVSLSAKPLIDDSMGGDRLIGLVTIINPDAGEPKPDDLYNIGTLARVVFAKESSDGTLMLIVHGLHRIQIDSWLFDGPYLRANVIAAPEAKDHDIESDAMHRSLQDLAKDVISLIPDAPKVAKEALSRVEDSLHLAYLVAANFNMNAHKRQAILELDTIKDKLRDLISHLVKEKEILTLSNHIKSNAAADMDKTQREFYLRKQLEAIQKELGEGGESEPEVETYRKRIETGDMSEEARKEAQRELSRLSKMSPQSAEYSVIKTYLDWLLDLPWNILSEDQLDISNARTILDTDHYGLSDVKERIVENLAVRNLLKRRHEKEASPPNIEHSDAMAVILCLAGPPGVGKTSLGQSIARALGRKFTRMSLGGIRDEAEIRGHRRTYIGAMPGRIIQAIKRAGSRNPVFMLDEIDKIGIDWRGDPSSALLEVLDPAQNARFRDHYLDVDFDLSEVIFITTANHLETVPGPLRDRMEIIEIDGYTEFEKMEIAKRHLIPRQLKSHGLNDDEIVFVEDSLRKIIHSYTREAGVRNLERNIGSICRKSAVKIAEEDGTNVVVTADLVTEYLKREKFEGELIEEIKIPGIATGLAVTAAGGDILYVEANRMNGKGILHLTGQLGDVMKESAKIAHSFVRSKYSELGIDSDGFANTDIHLHVPAGAVPKDGPSAGIAMVLTLASLFSGRSVRSDVGMTGEITLSGRVLPVGGIKMKVLAAHRAGLSKVILPKRNEKDLDDLPDEVRNSIRFILVDRIEEALESGLKPDHSSLHTNGREDHASHNEIGNVIYPDRYPVDHLQHKGLS